MNDMSLFDKTKEYFERSEVDIVPDETNGTIGFNYKGEHGHWGCAMRIREEHHQIALYSMYNDPVPAERHSAMLEFVARANFGMIIGNFEFDLRDGEVRFKTALDVGKATLSHKLIKPVVVTNLQMMDRYWRGIKSVIDGVNPEVAVMACEQAS